jgi:hypothetical protein
VRLFLILTAADCRNSEGVEDLTGGITTEIVSDDILDKDLLWKEGLLQVSKEFLFGAGTREYGHPDPDEKGRQGIEDGHAYSVLRAVEYEKNRLLMVKNPWGETEWTGPWSDGSKEWTADAIKVLDYKFGNDGIFWMPYEDFLERFVQFWRTRLFTPEWNVTQHWTTTQVPWSGDYNDTSFEFEISEPSRTVIVLSQLDSRYFGGLTGQYTFQLAFRLHAAGESAYIVRGYSSGDRSAVAEVDLGAGKYEVKMQIVGSRDPTLPKVEDVVKQNWLSRRDKLIRIGFSYDLAHAKGQIDTTDQRGGKDVTEVETATAVEAVPAAAPTSTLSSLPVLAPLPSLAPLGMSFGEDEDVQAGASDDTSPDSEPAQDKTPDDPWNAPVVVGLRVFCQNTVASVSVVRTEPEDVTAETKGKLDVDDPEKDAAEKEEPKA